MDTPSEPLDATAYLMGNGAPEDVAVIEAKADYTYADLADLSARIGTALAQRGLPKGARVGIQGPNSAFWIASYLAVMRSGLVAVLIPAAFTASELDRGARWVQAMVILAERSASEIAGIPAITRSDLPESPDPSWPAPASFAGNEDAMLMFTSGSTGRPRAVRITHANIQANTDSIVEFLGLTRDDRMLVVLPFTYSFGASLLHTHLRVGGSLVLVNSFVFPEKALDILERQRCTGLAGVPSSFHLLLRNSTFGRRRLTSLRQIQQAGGKLPAVLVEELVRAQPQADVFVMYGQTEATARLAYLPPDLALAKPGSVGRSIPGVELIVRDDSGAPVATGEVGEISARGSNISPGYFNDPGATADKFVDGELRTGDLAKLDDDGFIYIVDRAADFIKSWGYRISSQEVEAAAMELAGLVAAAAIGVPDQDAGERIHLFAVVRPGSGLDGGDILAVCRRRLAKHMVPSQVHLVASLPLNSNGKVAKGLLREMTVGTDRRGAPEATQRGLSQEEP